MYTTSRYASEETRRKARKLASGAGEPYIARGKHTIDQLADIARRRGQHRISILQDRSGIAVIEVGETGSWRWLKGLKGLMR